jgi:hypothetical protein
VTSETTDYNGEPFGDFVPLTDAEMAEAGPDDAPPLGPDAWRYFADVYDAKTIAWLRAYRAAHPEDEYIAAKLADIDAA